MSEFHAKVPQATVSEGLAQAPYVVARVGFEPTTLRSNLPMNHHATMHHDASFERETHPLHDDTKIVILSQCKLNLLINNCLHVWN